MKSLNPNSPEAQKDVEMAGYEKRSMSRAAHRLRRLRMRPFTSILVKIRPLLLLLFAYFSMTVLLR